MPIVPMILINGTDGIRTGWATKIPNYDPRAASKAGLGQGGAFHMYVICIARVIQNNVSALH